MVCRPGRAARVSARLSDARGHANRTPRERRADEARAHDLVRARLAPSCRARRARRARGLRLRVLGLDVAAARSLTEARVVARDQRARSASRISRGVRGSRPTNEASTPAYAEKSTGSRITLPASTSPGGPRTKSGTVRS